MIQSSSEDSGDLPRSVREDQAARAIKEQVIEMQRQYHALAHAMQSGVAMMMNHDPLCTAPKHLRVGVNSALVDSGALAGLLIHKGVITELEYFTVLRDRMATEVEVYRNEIAMHLGVDPARITLG